MVFRIDDSNIHDLVHNYIKEPHLLPNELMRDGKPIPIGKWDVSRVMSMAGLFANKHNFNEDISEWNVSNVVTMRQMFYNTMCFNQDLSRWNTGKVVDMCQMFHYAVSFNKPIGTWDTKNVMNMKGMFQNTYHFNQPIGDWDVSNVVVMESMFNCAMAFNQDLSEWNTGKVVNMKDMFNNAREFNQPIGDWDVSNVRYMSNMFGDANKFNQDLSRWKIHKLCENHNMFNGYTSMIFPWPFYKKIIQAVIPVDKSTMFENVYSCETENLYEVVMRKSGDQYDNWVFIHYFGDKRCVKHYAVPNSGIEYFVQKIEGKKSKFVNLKALGIIIDDEFAKDYLIDVFKCKDNCPKLYLIDDTKLHRIYIAEYFV